MIFNRDYFNALDRGFYSGDAPATEPGQPSGTEDLNYNQDVGVPMQDLGISTHPMQDQLQQLKSRIFQGASRVELGFGGKGKGSSQGNITPEMFGSDERRDIRELAKVNKVRLTTHASFAAGSLSGQAGQQFNEHEREKTLNEIKRAIDFAADTTDGGAIVVHANEFERPIYNKFDQKFQAYPEEPERALRYVVDDRSGAIQAIPKNVPVYEPVYKTNERGDWVDINGNIIPKDAPPEKLFQRVPEFNPEGTDFKTVRRDWDYFENRAMEWNALNPGKRPKSAEEMLVQIRTENQILRAKGSSLFYARQYEDEIDRRDAVKKTIDFLEKLDDNLPEEEKWKLMRRETPPVRSREVLDLVGPGEEKHAIDILKRELKRVDDDLRQIHEASSGADVQAAESQETIDHTYAIKDYALGRSNDTIARAATYALEREQHMAKWRANEPIKDPFFIAVENLFPEQYGGHPEEVKEMVLGARGRMVELLTQKGWSKEQAKQEAETRIKATWDTGHANLWRKYFSGSDDEFKKWYVKQAEDWKNNNIMGHVHVSDNFGFEDEHVVPGEGNVPLKEFMSKIQREVAEGKIDLIAEPNHQDIRALRGGWQLFGSSVYGLHAGGGDNWSDIQYSYFGRSSAPNFLYGESAPDPEAWQFWSGTRLE